MKGFLAAVELRRLAEHEQRIVETPFEELPAVRTREPLGPKGETRREREAREMAVRIARVKELRREGMSYQAIADASGLTERQVRLAGIRGLDRDDD